MSSKNTNGCGDSGAELTMPSDEEGKSFSSHSPSQPGPTNRRTVEPPLKEPWVPAPGRTSKARSHSFSFISKSNVENVCCSEGPETPGRDFPHEKVTSAGGKKRSGRSRTKRSRSIDGRKLSGLKLQTKDSLVDVTAYLNKRRDEVFQLWEKHVLSCDPVLLSELQNANTLAMETVNDLNALRKSIDNLKKKPGQFSEEESNALDLLRGRILSKLTLFEVSQEHIHQSLRASRDPSKTLKSRNSSTEVKSVAIREGNLSPSNESKSKEGNALAPIKSSLIYLKKKSKSYSDGDDTDDGEMDFDDAADPTLGLKQSVKSELEPQGETVQNLNPGKQTPLGATRKPKGSKSPRRCSTFEKMTPTILVDSIYYRDKIRGLHKKLMNQEADCVEMKREMKRIESQNEFDIRMLKSNMKAQLDDLGHLPGMLEFAEDRLNESIHAKFTIESSLQMKINEIDALKSEVGRLGKDLSMTQSKLISMEAKNETLTDKLDLLGAENKELKIELWNKSQLLASVESNAAMNSQVKIPEDQQEKQSHKLLFLEDKIGELEAELEAANKETLAMRRARNEISTRLKHRIEELMETLEESRAKNRSLQNQMSLIKARYFQLFVTPAESKNVFPETMKILAEANIGHEPPGRSSSTVTNCEPTFSESSSSRQ